MRVSNMFPAKMFLLLFYFMGKVGISYKLVTRKPQISAGLVLKHDWHVTPSVEVTASDVDDGSPRDRPSAGLQVHDLWDLDIEQIFRKSEVSWEVNWSLGKAGKKKINQKSDVTTAQKWYISHVDI